MSYALHTVEISKKYTLEEAKNEAQKFIKDKKKKFYRETKNFYRFRNISEQKFKKDSFKSKKINKDVILVYGELKDEYKNLVGAGFWDVIKNPIGTIKEAFSGIPTKLNNTATRTLNEFGKAKIFNIQIARTPLNNVLEGTINIISLGKMAELKKKYGFDKLFHLSLIVDIQVNKIIIEKNEVVTIEPLSQSSSIKSTTEFFTIPNHLLQNVNLNLDTLINNTRIYMGDKKFYDYEAFSNNCQSFIESILKSNALYTPEAGKFLMQDTSGIHNDLNKTGFSYVPKVVRKITDLGSIVSRLIGKGTKKNALIDFEKYMNKNNITEDDIASINEHFINFINSEGIKYI
jgi:RNase P/RNase MRP subunit POP5